MEEKQLMENVFREAKDLLHIFQDLQEKVDLNSKCLVLKSLDRFTIARNIVPFLEIKDILSFRATCKDINHSVNSTVSLVSYYKAMNIKSSKQLEQAHQKASFSNIRDLSESK